MADKVDVTPTWKRLLDAKAAHITALETTCAELRERLSQYERAVKERDQVVHLLRELLPLALIGAERRRTQLCDDDDAAEVMAIGRTLDEARAAIERVATTDKGFTWAFGASGPEW